jgi:hypothetical protein
MYDIYIGILNSYFIYYALQMKLNITLKKGLNNYESNINFSYYSFVLRFMEALILIATNIRTIICIFRTFVNGIT